VVERFITRARTMTTGLRNHDNDALRPAGLFAPSVPEPRRWVIRLSGGHAARQHPSRMIAILPIGDSVG
jgi:hypothetical protein